MFGLYDIDSEEIKSAFDSLSPIFGFSPETPGLPRYENDYYHRKNPESLGNWWIITSLWLAQYYSMIDQPERTVAVLHWVKQFAAQSGILPEQIDPGNGSFMSVAPLTWTHAEYLSTLLDTVQE